MISEHLGLVSNDFVPLTTVFGKNSFSSGLLILIVVLVDSGHLGCLRVNSSDFGYLRFLTKNKRQKKNQKL